MEQTAPVTRFTCDGIAPGTYDIEVQGSHTLKSTVIATISTTNTIVPVCTLVEGDMDDNETVNVDDFTAVLTAYLQSCGDGLYNAQADYNDDCVVNVDDFSIVLANYLQSGPTVCP